MPELETLSVERKNVIHMPGGLLGFERIKHYVLLENPEEAPFKWLQVLDDSNLAFLVVSPFEFMDYQPEISDDDATFLGLKSPSDALIYNIITLRGAGRATVNLRGPVVLNRYNLIGKQCVLLNASAFSLQHPLPVQD